MHAARPLFVVSDLHIGDGGPRDNFAVGDRRRELESFLGHVIGEDGQLVIVGDMFEFWQASLSKIIVANLALLDRLAAMDAIYVVGNHDVDLAAFIGTDFLTHPFFRRMTGPFEMTISGRRFKFMHGHEVDPVNCGDVPGWGRVLAIFAGIFEDQNGSPMLADGETVEDALTEFGMTMLRFWNWLTNKLKKAVSRGTSPSPKHELTPAQNPNRVQEMLQRYRDDREAEGYDVAIVGHTHQPGQLDGWYYNSGCWAGQTNSFLRISPSGQVSVFDWHDDGPVPNRTILQV